MQNNKRITYKRIIWEICIFALLGDIMFCAKFAMQGLPNIHMSGMLVMAYTLAFRQKALIPIYVYIMLEGLFYGFFSTWWIAYLYVWAVLWGITMLLPKKMPRVISYIVYPIICALHGLIFGILCTPPAAIALGFDLNQTLAYISMGFPFDISHAIGNFVFGFLVFPLSELLKKLNRRHS